MAGKRFHKRLIYFLAISAAVLFAAGLLQTSFFPQLGLFGAVPDLVLILVCGAAFYLGPVDGAMLGLVGGIIIEGLAGFGLALSPLLYLLLGVLFGALSIKMFRGKFWHYAVYSVMFCTAKAVYSVARIALSPNGDRLGAALLCAVLPEFVATLLLALLLAAPTRGFAGVLRGRMSEKKGKGGLGDL